MGKRVQYRKIVLSALLAVITAGILIVSAPLHTIKGEEIGKYDPPSVAIGIRMIEAGDPAL